MDRGRGQPQPLHRLAERGVIHRVITAAAIFDFAIADRRDLLERSHRVLREEIAHRVELDADGPRFGASRHQRSSGDGLRERGAPPPPLPRTAYPYATTISISKTGSAPQQE